MAAPLNIAEFRLTARRRLPKGLFEFIDRGCEDDVAERGNRTAFEALRLRPRILAGASPRSLDTQVLDEKFALPIGIGPVGVAGQVWHRGEIALARAAASMQVPFVLSGATSVSLEEVMRDGGQGRKWFQLYVSGDRDRSLQLIRRVHEAGYTALFLTVDSLVPYNREFAVRSGFNIPFKLRPSGAWDIFTHPRWLFGTIGPCLASGGLPQPVDYPMPAPGSCEGKRVALKDDSLDWNFLKSVREIWPAKLIVKGVLDPRDAELCAKHGADGLVVSNHGGISLDSAVAPIDALPDIVSAVGGGMSIMLDGGVRRGSDVIKALALGADLILLGRAPLYALATAGEAGVVRALTILKEEMDRILAQIGCRTIDDLAADYVVRSRHS
jgi:isopentenyl diphosphate isomerase/L-lactate dehydrogenase-like FMN-dependent dehydrogenase